MAGSEEDIYKKTLHYKYDEHCTVTVTDVMAAAVFRLKLGKRDDHIRLTSDHVKLASDEWFAHISMLFCVLVVHGSIIIDLYVTTLLPIPKGKNCNYSNSANHKEIALS